MIVYKINMKLSKMIGIYIGGFIILGICILASLAWGSRYIGFDEVISALTQSDNMSLNALVVRERIPRTVFALIAGASLGISGLLMQSITRNPIADPSILGVNTGASLFVVVGITFFNLSTASGYIWFALIGAALTSFCVYGIASIGPGGITPIKLALANTYNMGLGMVLAVDVADVDKAMEAIRAAGDTPYVVGKITDGEKGVTLC